jgi:hypothetical protein
MYWNPGNSISTVKSGNTNVKFCVAVHRRNLTYPKPPVYRLLLDRERRVPEISCAAGVGGPGLAIFETREVGH